MIKGNFLTDNFFSMVGEVSGTFLYKPVSLLSGIFGYFILKSKDKLLQEESKHKNKECEHLL